MSTFTAQLFTAQLMDEPEIGFVERAGGELQQVDFGRISVFEEETGEEVAVMLHPEVSAWAPAVYDAALAEHGWRRVGDWRYQLLARVERA